VRPLKNALFRQISPSLNLNEIEPFSKFSRCLIAPGVTFQVGGLKVASPDNAIPAAIANKQRALLETLF
jgi:hypothetical protein